MRKVVFFAGNKYYRIAPLLALGYMLVLFAVAVAGISAAIAVMKGVNAVVVIDPGHGGYDPGAITSQGVYEKNINLAISQKIKAELQAMQTKVILTREDDRDYAAGPRGGRTKKQTDLDFRIGLANQAQAEILVSVHVNANSGGGKSGAETFYNDGSEQGKALAESIQAELLRVPTMNQRVAKPAGYYITRKTKMTSVIVELGYLSNLAERKKLLQESYQQQLAQAIAKGILSYLATKG